jgi:hypothetical protein
MDRKLAIDDLLSVSVFKQEKRHVPSRTAKHTFVTVALLIIGTYLVWGHHTNLSRTRHAKTAGQANINCERNPDAIWDKVCRLFMSLMVALLMRLSV